MKGPEGINTTLDVIKNHKELALSGGLITAGIAVETSSIPSPEKEIVAIPTFLAGALIGAVGIFREWIDQNIEELKRLDPNADFLANEIPLEEGIAQTIPH
jgi:uncharacterized membrane protein YqgA involved in biofilm formation